MSMSRSARALVAIVTAFTLLTCHAAFAFQLGHRSLNPPASDMEAHGAAAADGMEPAHCHAADHNGDGSVRSPCDSATAIGEPLKIPTVSLVGWAPYAVVLDLSTMGLSVPARAPPAILAGAPPPLHLLHCRFLN
jgi:hypothetical protein